MPPVYPPTLRQAGITGVVSLNIVIGKDGAVRNIQVVSGPSALVAAAMDAVRQWRYEPLVLNGNPVEVSTMVDVKFPPQ